MLKYIIRKFRAYSGDTFKERLELLMKNLAVQNSCRTMEQLIAGDRYADLVDRRLKRLQNI